MIDVNNLSNNTLLLAKITDPTGTAKDLEQDFSISVTSTGSLYPSEVKDAFTRDWLDQDGTDVYNATKAYAKAFDVEIGIACDGTTPTACMANYASLLEYLTQGGILHNLYSPWVGIGRTNVRYLSTSDFDFSRSNGQSVMTCKLKFNVADPVNTVSPSAFVE